MRQTRATASASCALLVCCLVATMSSLTAAPHAAASELRRTAIVKAVEGARDSVVNIHGQKLLAIDDGNSGQIGRAVNGMGTGVLIDERGYLLTNFHVVDGVKRIQVTTAAGKTSIATMIAHDKTTDLAIIKIPRDDTLHRVPLGTSRDLMVGETVIAMGNAYGYNHSVTRGIISALHRDVPISETQQYFDLIQTDAGINPGNSGGPLLNIDGEMIGLNVAVRVGAQGIGFAIPADQAVEVAASLIRKHQRATNQWHGITGQRHGNGFQVITVDAASPAEKAGVQPGDLISAIGSESIHNAMDFELAMLDRRVGEELTLSTSRDNVAHLASLLIDAAPANHKWNDIANQAWQIAGLRLTPVLPEALPSAAKRYRGGLQVVGIRPGSPAEREHIQLGDILVGMHVWETVSLENVGYVLNQSEFENNRPVKCYILRDERTHYAYLPIRTTARR